MINVYEFERLILLAFPNLLILHKRTVDAADLGTTAEVLAAAKTLYRLVEGRSGRQILDFGQLPKRDQNRYINEAFKAFNDARKEMKCGSERKS